MKAVRYAVVVAVIVSALSSCDGLSDIFLPDSPPEYMDYYFLNVSFIGDEGQDLVAPLGEEYYKSDKDRTIYQGEVNPEKYSLEIETYTSYLGEIPFYTAAKFDAQHTMIKARDNGTYPEEGTWYLGNNLVYGSAGGRLPLQETLIYKVKCPTVFGDDLVHVIETRWEDDIHKGDYIRYPKCSRATLDGKEITPSKGITYNEAKDIQYTAYFLDIKL